MSANIILCIRVFIAGAALVGLAGSGVACDEPEDGTDTDEESEKESGGAFEAPSELAVETKEGTAVLTWKDNSDGELHFMLRRKLEGEEYDGAYGKPDAEATEYVDEDVESGMTYYYQVNAMPVSGDASDWSNEVMYTHP